MNCLRNEKALKIGEKSVIRKKNPREYQPTKSETFYTFFFNRATFTANLPNDLIQFGKNS